MFSIKLFFPENTAGLYILYRYTVGVLYKKICSLCSKLIGNFSRSQSVPVILDMCDAQKLRLAVVNIWLYIIYVRFWRLNLHSGAESLKKSMNRLKVRISSQSRTPTPPPTARTPQGTRLGGRGNGLNMIMITLRGCYHSS